MSIIAARLDLRGCQVTGHLRRGFPLETLRDRLEGDERIAELSPLHQRAPLAEHRGSHGIGHSRQAAVAEALDDRIVSVAGFDCKALAFQQCGFAHQSPRHGLVDFDGTARPESCDHLVEHCPGPAGLA